MKKSKVIIALLVILALLLIGALAFGGYKYMNLQKDNDKLTSDNKSITEELNKQKEEYDSDLQKAKKATEDADKNYITYNFHSGEKAHRIYAEGYMSRIIGYNNELYEISGQGSSTWSYINCANEITNGARFKDNIYSCRDNENLNVDEGDSETMAYKLNIKESDIYKVVAMNDPSTSDAKYVVFFIYKTGEVKAAYTSYVAKTLKSTSKYKIKDIKKYYCSNGNWERCGDLRLDVVLQDGTETTIKNVRE